MRDSQRRLVMTALAIPLLVLVGCSAGSPSDGETGGSANPYDGALGSPEEETRLQELYQATMDNGEHELVVYGPPPAQDFIDAFMDRFPDIEVVYQQLQSQDRLTRLEAEKASGNYVGDVAQGGRSEIVNLALAESSWCQPFDEIIDIPDDLVSYEGQVTKPNNTVFGIIINTDLISEDEAPRSWEELIDPKWKGRMVMVTPAQGGSGAFANAMLLTPQENADKWGLRIVEGIKENVSLVGTGALTVASVVDGTYAIGVLAYYPYYYQTVQDTPDAPVKFLLMDEGTPYSVGAQCILANAPHPNAANLWVNWAFSKEGQAMEAATGAYPSMPGSPGPVGIPGPDEASLITLLDDQASITGYNEYVKQVQALYGG